MNKKMKKDVKLSPSAIIAVGFLLLILTATLLLMLPISARVRHWWTPERIGRSSDRSC